MIVNHINEIALNLIPQKNSQSFLNPQLKLSNKKKLFLGEDLFALSLCGIFFLFWMIVLCVKYGHYAYYDWDLALSSNILWSVSQGHMFSSLLGTHFLANHANYIVFFLAPIFKIFPFALTLVSLKVLSFSLASFVLYKIARKPLGFIPAIALMLAYFIYPANISAIWFEFDFENFSALAFFVLFYFFFKGRLKPFLWTCFFTCLIKENAPLVVLFFGLVAFFVKKEKRLFWSGIPIALGLVFFLGSIFFIIPHFRKGFLMPHAYLDSYAYLGNPMQKIVYWDSLAFNVFRRLQNAVNIKFFVDLFCPLIVSLLSPGILFIGLPLFLQNFLSSKLPQHTVYFHYAASLAPFIFVATIVSLEKIKEKMGLRKSYAVLVFVLAFFIVHVLIYKQASFSRHFFSRFQRQDLQQMMEGRYQASLARVDMNDYKKKLLRDIPSSDSVIATFEFLPDLAARNRIFSFHTFLENRNPVTGMRPFDLPPSLNYALINFDDRWISFEAGKKKFSQARKFFEGDWSVSRAAGNIVLFHKGKEKGESILGQVSASKGGETLAYIVDPSLELCSVQLGDWDKEDRILAMDFFWRCLKKADKFYGMVFTLQNNERRVSFYPREIGYGLWPVTMWDQGVCVKEKVWLPVPQVPEGEYSLKVQFFYFFERKDKKVSYEIGKDVVDLGKVFLSKEK